jgi:hypothetical protein
LLCFTSSGSVQAPSSAGGDRNDSPMGWNSEDERDFEDQQYSPPSPMAYYPGSHDPELNPLARFIADLLDFNDVDMCALDDALRGLPVSDLCPPPPGLSLQDAMKVLLPFGWSENVSTHASFNTVRYKGRGSALGIDRKLSIIRPGATTIVAP